MQELLLRHLVLLLLRVWKQTKILFCHWRSLKDTHSVREMLKELLMTAAWILSRCDCRARTINIKQVTQGHTRPHFILLEPKCRIYWVHYVQPCPPVSPLYGGINVWISGVVHVGGYGYTSYIGSYRLCSVLAYINIMLWHILHWGCTWVRCQTNKINARRYNWVAPAMAGGVVEDTGHKRAFIDGKPSYSTWPDTVSMTGFDSF